MTPGSLRSRGAHWEQNRVKISKWAWPPTEGWKTFPGIPAVTPESFVAIGPAVQEEMRDGQTNKQTNKHTIRPLLYGLAAVVLRTTRGSSGVNSVMDEQCHDTRLASLTDVV